MDPKKFLTTIAKLIEEDIPKFEKTSKEIDELYMNLQKDALALGKIWELNQFLFHNWNLGIYEINKRFRRLYCVYASYDDYIDDCLEQEYEKQN